MTLSTVLSLLVLRAPATVSGHFVLSPQSSSHWSLISHTILFAPFPHRARHMLLTFSNLSYSVSTYFKPRVPVFLTNLCSPCQHSSSHRSLTSSAILLILVYRDPDTRLLTFSQIFQPTFAHIPVRTLCLSLDTILQRVHTPQASGLCPPLQSPCSLSRQFQPLVPDLLYSPPLTLSTQL